MNSRGTVTVQPTELEHVGSAIQVARVTAWFCKVQCGRCDRVICGITQHTQTPRLITREPRIFDESEQCRWCARPITKAAEDRVPLDGFARFAREWLKADRINGYDPLVAVIEVA